MPELPEVETVRRTLERQILNKTITDVKVYYERMLENCTKEDFISTLKGKTIKKIDRYGKYLIFGLSFLLMFQTLLNLSVVVGLVPITGVTLPFISYGGSSLVVSMISIGIILNVKCK